MAMQIKPRPAPCQRWWLRWGVLLALLPALWLSKTTYAQTVPFTQTVPFMDSGQTLGTEKSRKVALGDLDGDGDLDAFVVNQTQQPDTVWLNDGHGHMTDSGQKLDSFNSTDIALGDLDGDGDLDAVITNNAGNPNEYDTLWRNNGHGSFTEAAHPWSNQQSNAVALADLNGDGALDLFFAGAASAIWLNDGGGNFTQGQDISIAHITDVALGDLDRDGDIDAFLVVPTGIQIWRNEGQGNFAELDTISPNNSSYSVALADLDKDGDLDAFVIGGFTPSIVWRNDVSGVLTTTRQFVAAQQLDFVNNGQTNIGVDVSLGDVDGDGDIDAYVAERENGNDALFLNNGQGSFANMLAIPSIGFSEGVALGDLNGDGNLDLFLANTDEQPDQVFININSVRLHDTGQSLGQACSNDVALGDLDGDGKLDAVVANAESYGGNQADTIWLNQGNGIFSSDPSIPSQSSWGVALGDLDGNGSLDAFFVGDSANRILLNDGHGTLSDNGQKLVGKFGRDVALGDLDADGDLDAFVASGDDVEVPQPNTIWLNNGHGQFADSGQQLGNGYSASVALGDLDGDGDLDAVVANERNADLSQVWLNDGHGNFTHSADLDVSDAQGVVLGDLDGDGDLDAFFANGFFGQPERIFFNDGAAHFTASPQILSDTNSTDAAIGDLDGDGDLDVLVSNFKSNEVFVNDGAGHFSISQLPSGGDIYYSAVALGDLDNDGQLDAFTPSFSVVDSSPYCGSSYGQGLGARVWHNANGSAQRGYLRTTRPGPVTDADFYSTPAILADQLIPVAYTLDITATQTMRQVALYYSLNGGGRWLPATAQNQLGPASPLTAGSHSITWDTFASGFFGASDNVALRAEALSVPPSAQPGTYHYTKTVAGPYQWPLLAATTFPFRVRSTQVRVMQGGIGAPNALVYRLPQGQSSGALPIANQTGVPYHTDSQGYLQGRGQLAIGDRLVALAPITATTNYSLYAMSAAPTLSGLDVYTVTTAGVQTLTTSSAHPLLLFNLEVSLEWDARKETAFLNQLQFDLRRASEILFDATDGQAALGEITLVDNKTDWDRADIRIYASNAMIPNADPGGIVRSEVNEIIASNPFINATTPYSITYQPGRLRIGAIWNRFGEATGTLGEDWPRTLAHELGHYAFYLDDDYLGLQAGVVVPVENCKGTLMADQYREDFSEFHTVDQWATDCGQTILAQRTGRADWQTIIRFYPWLKMPTGQPNLGPATLPLAVTQVESHFAPTPTLPIEVDVFDLVDDKGKAQASGAHAQAVLYSQERLIDLGHPDVDKLEARGAHVGDRLCVYDLPKQQLGCKEVAANDNFLTLAPKPDWQPEIVVSPVTSRTVSVQVSNVAAGLPLQGKLYPENNPATATSPFVPWAGNSYSTTFQLNSGALIGYIQIWVDEADSPNNPRRESLTSYALGGRPGKLQKPPKGHARSLERTEQSGSQEATPAVAPDGQVLIYGNVTFADGEFYALQKVNRLPTPPLWTTVVGDGYRILGSAKAPPLDSNTSILFRYRGQDVPAGEENFLSLYFWDKATQQWRKLPTVLNRAVNEASAQAPGPGLYVLMSSLEIPLYQAGWNLVAYPVQETRPVSAALASISGRYSLVYGYVITDTVDPWKLYAPNAPAYVNDLTNLSFGQGYWINATQPVTWLIKGPNDHQVQAANSLLPPATYYGALLASAKIEPRAGLVVQARINGALCGETTTQAFGGLIVYTLQVVGDGSHGGACVGAGQRVEFTVAGALAGEASWQNQTLQVLNLGGGQSVYLPAVYR